MIVINCNMSIWNASTIFIQNLIQKLVANVLEDDQAPVKGEDFPTVESSPTSETEGGVSDDCGMVLLKRGQEYQCRFLHLQFEWVFPYLQDERYLCSSRPTRFWTPYNKNHWPPGRSGTKYDVFTNCFVADMLQRCEDILKPGGHGHVFSRAFSSTFRLRLFANGGASTLLPQTRCLQDWLIKESSSWRRRPSWTRKFRLTSRSLLKKLLRCQYEWARQSTVPG